MLSQNDNYLNRYQEIYKIMDYGCPCVSRGLLWAKYMVDELKKGDKVLCIGCGNGYEVVEYLLSGMDAYGTETHAVEDVPILEGKILNVVLPGLPFNDKDFDLVHCTEVLEHIPEEITIPFMLDCLRVGKKVLFTTSTKDDPPFCTHINYHPPEWWLARLAELNCNILNFQYNPMVYLRYEGKALSVYPDKDRVVMYVRH